MSSWDSVNDDNVILRVRGQDVKIWESYEVNISVFQQPSKFTLRCGWSKTAAEMLAMWKQGDAFQLFVQVGKSFSAIDSTVPVQVMSGRIDRVGAPGGDACTVEITGRDDMARIADAYVDADEAFHESTYYHLTRKVMDRFGLADRALLTSNLANRKAITGKKITEYVPPRDATTQQIEETTGGTRKVVYRTIKAQLGERWYDFLKRQYKRVGLFLFCGGDGSFILTDLNPNQEPVIKIMRRLPNNDGYLTPFATAAGRPTYWSDATDRSSKAVVWGRAQGGRAGKRGKVRGEYVDQEMIDLGFDKPITIHDDDVKTDKEAEYAARKWIAEGRRNGFMLEYPLSGHSAMSLLGGRAVHNIDTVHEIEDQEIGLDHRYYVTDVTFSANPARTTRVRYARLTDLVFAEELQVREDEAKSLPKHALRVQAKR